MMTARVIHHSVEILEQARGEWVNAKGYRCVHDHNEIDYLSLFGLRIPYDWTPVWEVTLDPAKPLTLRVLPPCAPPFYIQPDRHGYTNFGSIPDLLQLIPGFDRAQYPRAYILHDSSCVRHSVYISSRESGPFVEAPIKSETAHALLCPALRADGAREWRARTIYHAVRRYGPQW